jgi:hypothetical protein
MGLSGQLGVYNIIKPRSRDLNGVIALEKRGFPAQMKSYERPLFWPLKESSSELCSLKAVREGSPFIHQ